MKLILLFVQFILYLTIKADMIFEIKLIEYKNPAGKTYLDSACGPPNSAETRTDSQPCQTGFLMCLVDLPFRNPQNCSLGDVSTLVLGTDNVIRFDSVEDTSKYVYQFPIEKLPAEGLGMMIEVRDYWDSSSWGPVDFYTSTLADVPLATRGRDSKSLKYNVKEFRSLFGHKTTLRVETRLYCARNYFGKNCETFCNEAENESYSCDVETGELVCKEGFVGRFCQIPSICSTVPCLNNGECQSKDGINYACACQRGYSGYHCENKLNQYQQDIQYNPCLSQPCFNGGKCHEQNAKFKCECKKGFYGVYCEADLRSQTEKEQEKTKFASLLSYPSLTTKSLSAEKILNEFKALNDPQKILAYSNKISQLKVIKKIEVSNSKTNISFPVYNSSEGAEDKEALMEQNDDSSLKIYSSAEVEMLKAQKYELSDDLKKPNTSYTDLKRPCIDFNPCKHGACNLNNETMQFVCECNLGYMGPFCDIMRHPCDFQPCENGVCERVGDMYYKCLCKPNYTGVNCHVEIKPCDSVTCLNGGVCRNSLNATGQAAFKCVCPSDFSGNYCEKQSDTLLAHAKVTAVKSLCSVGNPCRNDGICYVKRAEDESAGTEYEACLCPVSHYGQYCEKPKTDCQMCLNGGHCMFTNTSVVCVCPKGYTGLNCEQDIDECKLSDNACENGAACLNSKGSYRCICLPGYYGIKCEQKAIEQPLLKSETNTSIVADVVVVQTNIGVQASAAQPTKKMSSPCDLMECLNNSTCFFDETIKIYKCVCAEGFSGKNCETHLDSVKTKDHLCDTSNPCLNEGLCIKHARNETKLGYKCLCSSEFTGVHCDVDLDPCSKSPCKNGACSKGRRDGSFTCECFLGYEGYLCDKDIDPCKKEADLCQNEGECIYDTAFENNYSCKCLPGFEGKNCETDRDECLSNPCLNDGKCFQSDRPNGYKCDCPVNFTGKNCQFEKTKFTTRVCTRFACQNNGTCAIINNKPMCVCPSGYFGSKCENSLYTACVNNVCANGGKCLFNKENKTIQCMCPKGYAGYTCEKQNLCQASAQKIPCYNNGTCLVSGPNNDEEHCDCKAGFVGKYCELRNNTNNDANKSIANKIKLQKLSSSEEINNDIVVQHQASSDSASSSSSVLHKSRARDDGIWLIAIVFGYIFGLFVIFLIVWFIWYGTSLKRKYEYKKQITNSTVSSTQQHLTNHYLRSNDSTDSPRIIMPHQYDFSTCASNSLNWPISNSFGLNQVYEHHSIGNNTMKRSNANPIFDDRTLPDDLSSQYSASFVNMYKHRKD